MRWLFFMVMAYGVYAQDNPPGNAVTIKPAANSRIMAGKLFYLEIHGPQPGEKITTSVDVQEGAIPALERGFNARFGGASPLRIPMQFQADAYGDIKITITVLDKNKKELLSHFNHHLRLVADIDTPVKSLELHGDSDEEHYYRTGFEVRPTAIRVDGRYADNSVRDLGEVGANVKFRIADPAIARIDNEGKVYPEALGCTYAIIHAFDLEGHFPVCVADLARGSIPFDDLTDKLKIERGEMLWNPFESRWEQILTISNPGKSPLVAPRFLVLKNVSPETVQWHSSNHSADFERSRRYQPSGTWALDLRGTPGGAMKDGLLLSQETFSVGLTFMRTREAPAFEVVLLYGEPF